MHPVIRFRTHPLKLPSQISYQPTLSIFYQPTLSTHTLNSQFQPTLSTHPLKPPSEPTLLTLLLTSPISGAFTERGHLHATRAIGLGLGLAAPNALHGSMTARSAASANLNNTSNKSASYR